MPAEVQGPWRSVANSKRPSRPGQETPRWPEAARQIDGDGYSEEAEFLAGTDPRDADSLLELTDVTVLQVNSPAQGREVTLAWKAAPARTYQVQMNTNLNSTIWTDLPGEVVAGSGVGTKSHFAVDPPRPRFYRVQLVP